MEKVIARRQHTLQPQRWRIIAIVTDNPGPGEAHLTADEIKAEFDKMLDLPAGITWEWGTIEKAAGPPPRSEG